MKPAPPLDVVWPAIICFHCRRRLYADDGTPLPHKWWWDF